MSYNDLSNMFEMYSFGHTTISSTGQQIIYPEMPTKEGYESMLLSISCNTSKDIVLQGCNYNETLGWRAFIYSNYSGKTSFTLMGLIAWIPK